MADRSLSDQLLNFEQLRVSALTKAAEISPFVKEVTIGPNSPKNKQQRQENHCDDNSNITVKQITHKPTANWTNEKVPRSEQYYMSMLQQYETQWRESADTIFKNLLENMVAKRAEIMSKYWKKQSEEYERKALQLKNRKLQMLKEYEDNHDVLEKAKLDEQNNQYINNKTIENMNRILEEQNKAASRYASITDSQTKICNLYTELSGILQEDNEYVRTVHNKYVIAVNYIVTNINDVLESCKGGVITDKEVKQAEVLALNMANLKHKAIEEITALIEEDEKRKKADDDKLKALEEAERLKIESTKKPDIENSNSMVPSDVKQIEPRSKPMFYTQKNFSHYQQLKAYLDNYEALYEDLTNDVNLKKYRFDCQKAVNTPVNAISSLSGVHIRDKFDKLSKLLKGERIQVMDSYISAAQHPQGLAYCTALLAKKIVRQGDLLVSSNPEAAFPLASVTVALWSQFKELGTLLEANFQRDCPYLVPMFLPQKEGQSDQDFYKSRGYTYNDEGVVEKQDKFLKRMSGIFRLCCAIWIAKTPKILNSSNPHGLCNAWRWLAAFINLKPETDISATLLFDFFTVCGSECYKYYGKQFTKIIKLISTQYLAILENIDQGGPKTRLEVYLQNVLKTGDIPPPSGLLQPNTW